MNFATAGSMTVYGTIGMTLDQSLADTVVDMTMGMVVRDDVNSQTSKIENYHVIVTDYSSYNEINIVSARVYDHYAGYVDVSTPTPLQDDGIGTYPSYGILLLQGAGGSSAQVDYSFSPPQGSWNDGQGGSGTFTLPL